MVDAFGAAATLMPDGKLSVKSSAVTSINAVELSIVKVRVEVAPCTIEDGENALVKVGIGDALIVRVALAEPELPRLDVRSPEVFTYVSARTEVTSTEMAQLAPVGTPAPDRLTLPAPAAAVTVPPVQELETLGAVATVTPVGKVSLKAAFAAATGLLVLSSVKVRVDVAPCCMDDGENALVKPKGSGAETTVSPSVALLLALLGSVNDPEIVAVLDRVPEKEISTRQDRV